MRQNLCQASLDVRKKLKYLVLQELIERSHQLFVSINALMRGLFLRLNLVKMLPLDTHSIHHPLLASILMRNIIWNVDKRNCALTFSRCNERVVLFTKHWWVKLVPLHAVARGGARPKPAQQHLCFQKLARLGRSPPAQIARSFSKLFALFSHMTQLALRGPRRTSRDKTDFANELSPS